MYDRSKCHARAAVDVLSMVRQASEFGSFVHSTPQPYGRLVETYPDQIRALLQWGLQNRDQLVPTMRLPARELSSCNSDENEAVLAVERLCARVRVGHPQCRGSPGSTTASSSARPVPCRGGHANGL
jgi:hypothetical protein